MIFLIGGVASAAPSFLENVIPLSASTCQNEARFGKHFWGLLMALTVDTLLAAVRTVRGLPGPPTFRIVFSPTALKDSSKRLSPERRNRSKRIHKKLGKRSAATFARSRRCGVSGPRTVPRAGQQLRRIRAGAGPSDEGSGSPSTRIGRCLPSPGSGLSSNVIAALS
jgi:hypothetical protein